MDLAPPLAESHLARAQRLLSEVRAASDSLRVPLSLSQIIRAHQRTIDDPGITPRHAVALEVFGAPTSTESAPDCCCPCHCEEEDSEPTPFDWANASPEMLALVRRYSDKVAAEIYAPSSLTAALTVDALHVGDRVPR